MTIRNEITITVHRNTVEAVSQGGAGADGDLHLDQLRLATIKVFEEWLLVDQIQSRRHMEVLGQHLYAAIFDVKIDKLLNDKLSDVRPDRLRLQLRFGSDVDAEVASLPWEFLYSPTRADFLATDINLVLSRFIQLNTDRELFDPSKSPLRVLGVISGPNDEPTVVAKKVFEAIDGLNEKGKEKSVELRVLKQPTLTDIEEALKDFDPQIFHFVGHGKFDAVKRTGFLLLVDPQTGNSDPCDDSTLINCFKDAQCTPRLVFLHMCEGGVSEKDATVLQAFSGFAPKLIYAKIPSVVAMQYPIKNENARDFSLAFYATLAEGGSVDEAVQEGRRKLDRNRRSRLFGTPVLYMQSADGLVVPKPVGTTPGNQPGTSSGSEGTSQKPSATTTAGTPAQPAPITQAALDKVITAGVEAAKAIPSDDVRIDLTRQLFKMKDGLKDKTSTTIFNVFYQRWEQEADPHIKQVWEQIMQIV